MASVYRQVKAEKKIKLLCLHDLTAAQFASGAARVAASLVSKSSRVDLKNFRLASN